MRYMITGAGGFIGGAIAKDLVASGHEIVTFQRGQYPHLDALGGTHVVGDLSNLDLLAESMRGCDGVFHVAALAAISGDPAEFEKANIQGTQNIITACRREKIGRLVFTSSPSVVFSGEDQNGINESTPYPDSYLADYPRTKAIAEKLVLDNCDASLFTIAIRPHLVWGPGDRHLYPRIIDRAKNGKLKLVRRPGMKIDACYIENAVSAHVLAMTQIAHNVDCRGKAYFISNDEPIAPDDLINQFLECANLQRITPSISPLLAKIAGYLIEKVYCLPFFTSEPPVTRFVVHQQATSHWFDLDNAKRDLGWLPQVSTKEGMKKFRESLESEEERVTSS